jgi:hypothetical protein
MVRHSEDLVDGGAAPRGDDGCSVSAQASPSSAPEEAIA